MKNQTAQTAQIDKTAAAVPALTQALPTLPTDSATASAAWMTLRATGLKSKIVAVANIADASITFQCWRDRHSLGNRRLGKGCGQVLAGDRQTVVAQVSYNGRVWSPDGGKLLAEATKWQPAKATATDPEAVKSRLAECVSALHVYWEAQRMLEQEMGFTIEDIDGFVGDNFAVAEVSKAGDIDDDTLAEWMVYATEHREVAQ